MRTEVTGQPAQQLCSGRAEGGTPWFGGQGSSGSVKLLGGEDISLVAVLHFGRSAVKFVTGQ